MITIQFVKRNDGPEPLECEAEIHFGEDGPLAGMKLVGITLWRGAEDDIYVTFPSRAFGAGADRRYFDYLRSADGVMAATKRLKDWILDEYRKAGK